jgi:hypothetical protein
LIKITLVLENINQALEKYEYLDTQTLADAITHEISQTVNSRRNDLTNRIKARDLIPQLAFDYSISQEITKKEDEK